MECHDSAYFSDEDYWKNFLSRARKGRVPLSGSIELTRNCNFRCIHCYLDNKDDLTDELDTDQWLKIIDTITHEGCLFLLITGGEALLRKDFKIIYSYAKKKGLIITIFTNGTNFNEELIGLFKELPPRLIEITLYGASSETSDSRTETSGSYEKCLQGINKLNNNGIPFRLKTMLMTKNISDFHGIERIARDFGVGFRLDAAINPRIGGDKVPLKYRVEPDDVVRLELSDKIRFDEWKGYCERRIGSLVTDYLFTCSAGLTSFHIDARGFLTPCIISNDFKYNLLKNDFSDIWNTEIIKIRKLKMEKCKCKSCGMRDICGFCPISFKLEMENEEAGLEYFCEIGIKRLRSIA